MEMGNARAVEEKVTVRGVNCLVSPSLFLLSECPEEEAGKQQKQERMAKGRSAVSAGSSQQWSSAPPCFPGCPGTVSRL